MNKIIDRASRLLSVKSIVTIISTAVFAYLSIKNALTQEFTLIYASIIGYYFGTQGERIQNVLEQEEKRNASN